MKKRLVAIIGLAGWIAGILVALPLHAKESSSAQFLKLGAGAQAAGMADAFTSVANDVTAGYWNPAGLSQVQQTQLAVMQNNWLVDTQYQYLGGAIPMEKHTMALSLYRVDYGTIERYTASDTQDGNFEAGSMAGSLSVSSRLDKKMNWGLSIKYLNETLESQSASGMALDLGVLYRSEKFNFGAAVQNLGPKMKFIETKESLPRIARMGISRRFFQEKLTAALDVSKSSDFDASIHTGLDMKVNSILSLRGGYKTTPGQSITLSGLTNMTVGMGLHLQRLTFDYAFLPYGDLGNTHRFSILFAFHQPQ